MDSGYTGTDNLEVMKEAVNYNNYLVSLITHNLPKDKKSLTVDFGAGIGTFSKILHDDGVNILSVENDSKEYNILKEIGLPCVKDINTIEDNSIDYIYSLNVLEHIQDDAEVVNMFYKKIKHGGTLFLYLPAMNILFSSMDEKVNHYRRYDKKMLKILFSTCNFEIENINYADCVGFFATLAYKLLGNSKGDINLKALKTYDKYIFPISLVSDRIFNKLFGKNIYITLTKR